MFDIIITNPSVKSFTESHWQATTHYTFCHHHPFYNMQSFITCSITSILEYSAQSDIYLFLLGQSINGFPIDNAE